MCRRAIGGQQADGDGTVFARGEGRDQVARDLGLIELLDHRAGGVDPFGDLEAIAPSHRWRGLGIAQIINVAAVMALQEQDVAEAPRGHEGNAGALALQDRVGGDGRAMHQVGDLARRDASGPQRRERPHIRPRRGAGDLGDPHLIIIDRHQVGEHAHFDADPHGPPSFDVLRGAA